VASIDIMVIKHLKSYLFGLVNARIRKHQNLGKGQDSLWQIRTIQYASAKLLLLFLLSHFLRGNIVRVAMGLIRGAQARMEFLYGGWETPGMEHGFRSESS
jgi:hypothetical protein